MSVFGFDGSLNLLSTRSITASIHSVAKFEVNAMDFDTAAFEAAQILPILNFGEREPCGDDSVLLITLRNGESGTSLAVQNCANSSAAWKATGEVPIDLLFQLDCSESSNVVSNLGKLKTVQCVPIGQSRLLMHTFPCQDWEERDWELTYTAAKKWQNSLP